MLLILAATPLETPLLRQQLQESRTLACGTARLQHGRLGVEEVIIAHGGVGAMLMAMQLTRILSAQHPRAILLCGCGGSYPDSGLQIGDLAVASSEIYGDCGVATATGFIPLAQLEIPQNAAFAPTFQQEYPLDGPLLAHAREQLPRAACGPFVTVNCCSGTAALSRELHQRTGGICENMEGAAAAQVCAAFGVPLLELRGISNQTGPRDLSQWDLPRALETAQQAVLTLLRQGILSDRKER
jgi:futalosine hydrolase